MYEDILEALREHFKHEGAVARELAEHLGVLQVRVNGHLGAAKAHKKIPIYHYPDELGGRWYAEGFGPLYQAGTEDEEGYTLQVYLPDTYYRVEEFSVLHPVLGEIEFESVPEGARVRVRVEAGDPNQPIVIPGATYLLVEPRDGEEKETTIIVGGTLVIDVE